jgi:hypothetical protein
MLSMMVAKVASMFIFDTASEAKMLLTRSKENPSQEDESTEA